MRPFSGLPLSRAATAVGRLIRGPADQSSHVLAKPDLAPNRIWSQVRVGLISDGSLVGPLWGVPPPKQTELVVDVFLCKETRDGLVALGFGTAVSTLADPFRLVVTRNGLYFYSYGDRKHLDLWIDWPSVRALGVTAVHKWSWQGRSEPLKAVEITVVDARDQPIRFPLIARAPGSGSGAIDISTDAKQKTYIAQMDSLYAARPAIADSRAAD